MLFSGQAVQLPANNGSDAIMTELGKVKSSLSQYSDGGDEDEAKREAMRRSPSLKNYICRSINLMTFCHLPQHE